MWIIEPKPGANTITVGCFRCTRKGRRGGHLNTNNSQRVHEYARKHANHGS